MWYAISIRNTFLEITVYASLAGVAIGISALVGANLYDYFH